jgi:hypothetical protein
MPSPSKKVKAAPTAVAPAAKKSKKAAADDTSTKKKKVKDPNAPKGPSTSYIFFSNVKRNELKEKQPDLSFKEFAEKISVLWKSTSDAEKAIYEKMAQDDKQRYAKEMENYTPPPGLNENSKRKKDPNAPKGFKGSYMFYSMEQQPKIKAEQPDLSFGDIAKVVSARWKELSPESREPYEKKAADDKARYTAEMESYVPPAGSAAAIRLQKAEAKRLKQSAGNEFLS